MSQYLTKSIELLREMPAGSAVVDLIPKLTAALPDGSDFEAMTWNIASWSRTPRAKFTVDFSKIGNPDLIVLAKLRVLELRAMHGVASSAANMFIVALCPVGQVLQARSIFTLTSGDFVRAERLLKKTYSQGTASRMSDELARIARWLRDLLGRPIEHTSTVKSGSYHGRASMAENREDKLLPTEVLVALLEKRHNPDILFKDRFYLNVLSLQTACGFRACEASTLPVDCLIDDDGALLVRNFSSKGGRSAPRPISPQLASMVREAVQTLTEITEPGRAEARRIGTEGALDWKGILQDAEATAYFVGQIAHAWTTDPNHRLINPDGAWHQMRQDFLDIVGSLRRNEGNASAAARSLDLDRNTFAKLLNEHRSSLRGELSDRSKARTSWDTDDRAFSTTKLMKKIGLLGVDRIKNYPIIKEIVDATLLAQIANKFFPRPADRPYLEAKFQQDPPVALRSSQGNVLLLAQDALLVLEKYRLSDVRSTKGQGIHLVTTADLGRWLAGEKRGRGTGGPGDSAAARLGVMHPRTGEPARFVWHDVRHWLDTVYEDGGLSQDQIAMMFNRSSIQSNSPYSHTSHEKRSDRLRETVLAQEVGGHITKAAAHLAEIDRDKAESYLRATTKTHNPMPHGICTLNWAAEPCPHHLSCFSCNTDKTTGAGRPCEHLVVDLKDPVQKQEVLRLRASSESALAQMDALDLVESPQFSHQKRIVEATAHLLANHLPTEEPSS